MLRAFRVYFADRLPGWIEAATEAAALAAAAAHGEPRWAKQVPYPHQHDEPLSPAAGAQAFCVGRDLGEECEGRATCPRKPACSE